MVAFKKGRGVLRVAGLLLFAGACTLSSEDIDLSAAPAGEGGTAQPGPEQNEGGGGGRQVPDDSVNGGRSGGSGGTASGQGGQGGQVIGQGGTSGAAGSTGTGGGLAPMAGGAPGTGGRTPDVSNPPPPLMTGGTSGTPGGSGGTNVPATGGMAGNPGPLLPRATSFDFETDTQGWRDLKGGGAEVSRTTSRAFSGSGALQITFATQATDVEKARYVGVPQDQTPLLRPGQTIRFRIFIPPGNASSALQAVQPFTITAAGLWHGNYRSADQLSRNNWIDIDLNLPNGYVTENLLWFGVQIFTREDGPRVTVLVDGITF